ncbi:benzoylformate decarboxylase [Actinomycetospora chibensis]|uniref:Benzoylformate decarboxylase n=1 Tax=Actinomycetospora chibensis TaxID=663606 RepID=A0ABV9RDF3_9PSEU|nr:benzoylformate decarboxylase [Actinomycetospora chibensis]MDD7927577.1 benzoylformate decarboxylase [Actinomycetospora chibensis]
MAQGPTVREASLEVLRAHGMTTIFGNPGSTELPMLSELPDDFRYVLGLQEAAVVGMADGYAQARGRPTLVNLHTAPGVGNAVGALVNASANGAPLVVTAGQQVRPMMNLEALLTNPDATVLPRPTVKLSLEPARPADVPAVLARAIHVATSPPWGPVFVSVPMDDWDAVLDPATEAAGLVAGRRVHQRAAPDPAGLDLLVEALDAARAPALVVGGDVDATGGFHDAVALAERIGAAVFAPPVEGRVGFPTDHPQFQGPLPMAIAPVAQALEPFDVVLVVGAPVFRYYPYVPGPFLPEGTRLLHVTADHDQAARAPMGDAVVADPALTVRALLERVGPGPADRAAPPSRRELDAPRPGGEGRLSAEELFTALADEWPDGGVLVNEAPSHRAIQQERLPITQPGSSYFTTSGGLGFGLPAAVGVAIADPSRPVVAVLGDGSLQYAIQALATAATQQAPVTIIVLDNREYAILKWFAQREQTPKVPGLDLPAIDHLALAQGYGVPAETVGTVEEFRAAVRRGVAGPGPRLVHVPVPPAGG